MRRRIYGKRLASRGTVRRLRRGSYRPRGRAVTIRGRLVRRKR